MNVCWQHVHVQPFKYKAASVFTSTDSISPITLSSGTLTSSSHLIVLDFCLPHYTSVSCLSNPHYHLLLLFNHIPSFINPDLVPLSDLSFPSFFTCFYHLPQKTSCIVQMRCSAIESWQEEEEERWRGKWHGRRKQQQLSLLSPWWGCWPGSLPPPAPIAHSCTLFLPLPPKLGFGVSRSEKRREGSECLH